MAAPAQSDAEFFRETGKTAEGLRRLVKERIDHLDQGSKVKPAGKLLQYYLRLAHNLAMELAGRDNS